MDLHKIKGNTYYFETKFSYIPLYKLNENDVVLLDSGMYDGDYEIVRDLIDVNKLNVKAVICSHAHIDHIGNNYWLQENYGTEIIMPIYEAFTCSSMYNLMAYSCHPISRHNQKRYESMICRTDRMIEPDDTYVEVGHRQFKIVNLYGHSSYQIGIITPDDVFYIGDALMSCDVMEDTKIAYVSDLKEDIKTKIKLKNIKCDKYVIAHKSICDNIDETIDKNIEYFDKLLEMMVAAIDEPMTESEAFAKICGILGISKRVNQYLLAEMMIKPYIMDLIDNGLIGIDLAEGMLKYVPLRHSTL